jgi:histone-lysine N-methyltransferase SUV420H
LQLYYWTTIRKNRGGRFSASRGLQEEDIADILRKTVIIEKEPAEAVKQLLQLSGLRKFVGSLKDEKEKDHFTRHLLRYVKIYMPDCPFEVTTTNRYTINEHEASVTARREIKANEEIKYLTGVQVAMTEEQEKTLELARKDFSLVISSRKKTRSLFLGPARFANHDCDANARLSTKGYDGMQIVAVKPIDIGDEITVSYGEDYFGDDNEECLCQTCETRLVNGWAPYKEPDDEDDEDEEDKEDEELKAVTAQKELQNEGHYSLRRKRKYASDSAEVSPESTKKAKKVKVEEEPPISTTPPGSPPGSPLRRLFSRFPKRTALGKTLSSSSLRQEVPISSVEDPATNLATSPQSSRKLRTQQRVGLLTVTLDETASSRNSTPQSSATAGSPKSFLSTEATSLDEDSAMPDSDDSDTIVVKPTLGVAMLKTEKIVTKTALPAAALPAICVDDTSSELSELSSSYELDDVLQKIVKRKRSRTPPATRTTRSHSRYTEKNVIGTPIMIDPEEAGLVENKRKPGDYVKSDALLSAKYSKWVECHTCDDVFVQQDGYHTRKECPRCERHSKLYGFAWPKTDREGKHDKEERILDHRTVHRFVDPDEEKVIKKSRKSLKESIVTRFSTPRSDFRESSMSTVEPDSGRQRRRLRKTM